MIRAALLALALAGPAAAQVPEPDGYRMGDYRAPVPDTLSGARVITPAEAHAIWSGGTALFVDVLPRPPRPRGLPEGTIFRQPPRRSIPGAVWFPNAGYGDLAPVNDAWFRDGLAAETGGDLDRPLVVFCLMDCWMSWNAARRAMTYGYRNVLWLPEGTDGWAFEGYPLEPVEPRPGGR